MNTSKILQDDVSPLDDGSQIAMCMIKSALALGARRGEASDFADPQFDSVGSKKLLGPVNSGEKWFCSLSLIVLIAYDEKLVSELYIRHK